MQKYWHITILDRTIVMLPVHFNNPIVVDNYNSIQEKNISDLMVNEQGLLVKKGFWTKLLHWLNIGKAENNKGVEQTIENVISVIDKEINGRYLDKNFTSDPEKVKNLFNKIANSHFNPIIKNVNLISVPFQNFLDDELAKLRQAKINDPTLKNDQKHTLLRRMQKARLAEKLGLIAEQNKGTTGTVIIKGLSKQAQYKKGKSIGIFKRGTNSVALATRVKNFFKKTLWGQLHYLSRQQLGQANAEVAAYLLDQHLGFNITPPSQRTNFLGEEGTFQLFVIGRKEAKDLIKLGFDKKTNYNENEIYKFQLMAVFDYLIGNLDRHEENWFVEISEKSNENDPAFTNLNCIDNANSFPIKHPSKTTFLNLIKLWNQYKWRKLKIADQKFCPQIVEFVKNISNEQIDSYLELLNKNLPDFLEPGMQKTFEDRLGVLRKMVQEDYSPHQLGKLRTQQKIAKILSE